MQRSQNSDSCLSASVHPHFTPSLFPSRESPPPHRENSVDSRTVSEPGELMGKGGDSERPSGFSDPSQ